MPFSPDALSQTSVSSMTSRKTKENVDEQRAIQTSRQEMTVELSIQGNHSKSKQCKVCGDMAKYAYFGVIACHPCKMFFKRYAENKEKNVVCVFGNQCEITTRTRQICAACRLKKCFTTGMQVEKIRRSSRKTYTKTKRDSKSPATPTNSVQHEKNHCLLTFEEWALFNNLTQHFDPSMLLIAFDRFNRDGFRTMTLNEGENLQNFYRIAAQCFRKNFDFKSLLPSDRSILLQTSMNNIFCLITAYNFAQTGLNPNSFLIQFFQKIFGSTVMNFYQWLTKYLGFDHTIFKLALALFSLSSTNRTCLTDLSEEFTNHKAIFEIEHRYTELIWKYLLYKNGPKMAMKNYVQLIRCFLGASDLINLTCQNQMHMIGSQSTIEHLEIEFILDDDQ